MFGIFILFALLIACIGVTYASSDFDDSSIDVVSASQGDIDDVGFSDIDDDQDDSDMDDDYFDDDSDSDIDDDSDDDDDWDDFDDDDDDFWDDDDDWDDYGDDDDFWDDDDDWDDYGDDDDFWDDYENDGEYDFKVVDFNSVGMHVYKTTCKGNAATGCAYENSSDDCETNDDNQDSFNLSTASSSGPNYPVVGVDLSQTLDLNQDSVSKTINSVVANEDFTPDESNTSVEDSMNDTNVVDSTNNDNLSIFAILALLLVTLAVII